MINSSLKVNERYIKNNFAEDDNLFFRYFTSKNNKKCMLVFFDNLTNAKIIAEYIISPIIENNIEHMDTIQNFVNCGKIEIEKTNKTIIDKILKGSALLFIEGESEALSIGVIKVEVRQITEPPTSAVLKGPRAGFNESLKINVSLIRRILNTNKLAIKSFTVGKYTNTQIAVMYIDGIAKQDIVDKISKIIESIKIDGVIDSNYILQYLEEKKDCLFKQVGNSEKPDVISAKMLEGRVAIMVDGSPMALTVPFILLEDLQASGDYYSRPIRAIFMRIIRFSAILFGILLPGAYVAVQLYHYRIIPLRFLVSIMNSTQKLPLTPFVEILFVIILFDILYEAGLRMPRYLGMALSIVGALVLGQTAVSAALISPPSVMIVALSGITFYTVPEQNTQLLVLRLFFTFIGGILGLYGIVIGVIFVIGMLCDLDSYGAAYLSPLAPYVPRDQKDFLFKQSVFNMKTRPISIPSEDKRRMK